MKSIYKTLIAGTLGVIAGGATEWTVKKALDRRYPDILETDYEPVIGDGADDDLKEDPTED